MPNSPKGATPISDEDFAEIKDLLAGELGFGGKLTINISPTLGASPEKKVGRPKKAESVEEEITEDKLRQACAELARKLNNKNIVLELLKKFGGNRIADIPKDKYAALLNAISNYEETTTSKGESEDEF
jgi:hypothetical protein